LKKTKAQTKIKIRGHVYIAALKSIIHLLTHDAQKVSLKHFKDSHHLYVTVLRGASNKGYFVSFDIFPAACKICVVIRKYLTAVADGDEETTPGGAAATRTTAGRAGGGAAAATGRPSYFKQSELDFLDMEPAAMRVTTSYNMRCGDDDDSLLEWKSFGDPMEYPDHLVIKKAIDFRAESYVTIFFRDFFPSIEGHARLLDENFVDIWAPFHKTVVNERSSSMMTMAMMMSIRIGR
jgi:hypothetical protein